MTDEIIVRARQNCCRLCLAPDSECVPILSSLAADKEPLPSKIQACVNVKVNQSDNLSLRVCHSCISFLNAWQSFKNRCLAAQMKQTNWLEMAKNTMRRKMGQIQQQITRPTVTSGDERLVQTKATTGRPMPIPIIIKDEPVDEEADAQEQAAMRMNLDPRDFLGGKSLVAKQEIEDDEYADRNDDGPQILRSLGLTHITKLNPYNKLNTNNDAAKKALESGNKTSPEIPPTQCRFCNMKFSSATNARRHERNIHRSGELNPETPKICIKPTTARSLLKPLHTLRPQSTPIVSTISVSKTSPTPTTPEMMGFYDYDKPEKYRNLLTDTKLVFIRKNEEFLSQYQTMTCTCCPQTFASYKAFMAHMRRKYTNLGRNLCFKCLKQFQTKTPFVTHLKKKNCINLYKLYKMDNDIPKIGTITSPEKQGTKELLNNKLYECTLCSKSFRLKLDFRSHVYESHGGCIKKDASPGRCGFCNTALDDPALRRRHYNNMECIVKIHCGTCNEKFDLHQQFTDHVYETHLTNNTNNNVSVADASISSEPAASANASFAENVNSRLPHSCNICGQTYNNYYNVLRHMEGKHPDQVPKRYMCDKCDAGFSRQGPLRDHMYEVHGTTLPRVRREMLSCRMCSEQIDSKEKWIQHQTEQHSRYTCCFCAFQSKNLDLFKEHIESHPQLSTKNHPILAANALSANGGNEGDDEEEEEASPPAKRIKLEPSDFECDVCHASFSGNVALSNHMRVHYSNEDGKSLPTAVNGTPTQNATSSESALGEQVRRIRCHLCSKRFTSKITYRKHMLGEHQIRNVSFIKCSICKAEFTHERGLRVHLHKSHDSMLINETVNAIYECEVCDAEFKSEKSLNQHRSMAHRNLEIAVSTGSLVERGEPGPVYWYQCSYCPGHFDTSKKLAIHLNVHTEHDSTDYSCKDCGNVYNGRKSLWVHRHKKHREVPEPSPCPICKKLFFSKKMLDMHVKHHSSEDQEDEHQVDETGTVDYVAENEPDNNEEEYEHPEQQGVEFAGQQGQALLNVKVHCTVCNEEFSDQDLFDKHMEMHQIDLYSDNPLAAMFDTGPEDPNQIFMNQMSENGAFTCDICAKTFPALTALKVHRNWHFRQDGKLAAADSSAKNYAQKKKAQNVCEFCDTAFSSTSNLKRHIVEVHNRNSQNHSARAKKNMDKYLECTKCKLKFEEKSEWVKHKISHVNECSASTYEWGCEICGKIVSRKDRLIQHLNSHLKSNVEGEEGALSEDQSNSRDTVLSSNTGRRSAVGKPRTGDDDDADDETAQGEGARDATDAREDEESVNDDGNEERRGGESEEEEGGEESKHAEDNRMHYDEDSSQQYQEVNPDDMQDDDDEENEEGGGEEDDDNIGAYSCDLCQVYFETSKQLRRHVTSHFLNGPGSVTLTQIPKEKSYSSKRGGDDTTTITPV